MSSKIEHISRINSHSITSFQVNCTKPAIFNNIKAKAITSSISTPL